MATTTVEKLLKSVNGGIITLIAETADTADDTNTFTVDLAANGITKALTIRGYTHTTDYSVIAAEVPTTSVSAGVMTVTLGSVGGSNKRRVVVIEGRSNVSSSVQS